MTVLALASCVIAAAWVAPAHAEASAPGCGGAALALEVYSMDPRVRTRRALSEADLVRAGLRHTIEDAAAISHFIAHLAATAPRPAPRGLGDLRLLVRIRCASGERIDVAIQCAHIRFGWTSYRSFDPALLVDIDAAIPADQERLPWRDLAADTPVLRVHGALDEAAARNAIRGGIAATSACHEQVLARRPDFATRALFDIVVRGDGWVVAAWPLASLTPDARFEACVASGLRRVRFPRTRDGKQATVRRLFVFKSGIDDGQACS